MEHEYRELEIWKRLMNLVEEIYRLTKSLPDEEKYGLISQMRRASVSIPSNISEGKMRSSGKDFRVYLFRSIASCAELQTQLEICERLGYCDKVKETKLRLEMNEIMHMIRSFIAKMNC
ncbi:four helix bundle protein [Candidatus Uhrbacteria bacterium]|nr:four helix bundle protein [Candidatus Uhrbacteria bacterium]